MEVMGGHDLYYETHALIPVLDWKLSAHIMKKWIFFSDLKYVINDKK